MVAPASDSVQSVSDRGADPDPGLTAANRNAPLDTILRSAALLPDADWWRSLARLVVDIAGPRDMRLATVLVPDAGHGPTLRAALYEAAGRQACIPPRLLTLEAWLGIGAGIAGDSVARERVEMFQALRDSAWVREQYGGQANAIWALAGDIAHVSDELTMGACGRAEAFTGRWRTAVHKHFSERAAAAGEPQVQLILALWRAGLAQQRGAAQLQARLADRVRTASGPLVWILPHGPEAWQREFCSSYANSSRAPVRIVTADWAGLAAKNPRLRAAWPELTEPAFADEPQGAAAASIAAAPIGSATIAARAHELARLAAPGMAADSALHTALRPALTIWKCESLEEEANATAQWTVERLRAGCASIALVALDRLAARRVRALLDRAGILVADSSGWKLSTTSAAAAIVHWIDAVLSDFGADELLDWMRSPFVLADDPGKDLVIAHIADTLRHEKVRAGMDAVRAALVRQTRHEGGHIEADGAPAAAGGTTVGDAGITAVSMIDRLIDLARPWRRPGSMGRCFGLLAATLDALGMRTALAADPVGALVLKAIDELHTDLIGSEVPVELREFRSFIAAHFEGLGTGDRAIASPVEMLTLGGTRLRHFDAAILIGADAEHLNSRKGPGTLLADSVRRELGLRTDVDRERELVRDLAALLANTPLVGATWRRQRGEEPQALAPLFERLAMVGAIAGLAPVVRAVDCELFSTTAADPVQRAARAPGMLPAQLSASGYQDMVDCPYRFFALRMLGLREVRNIGMHPDNRDFGEILHEILFTFHRARPARREDDLAALREICDRSFARWLVQRPALIASRQRARLLLAGYVAWVHESEDQGWHWTQGEFTVRRTIALDGGAQLELQGRIDRIDRDADGNRRILDYKARDPGALRKSLRNFGEEVQLHFYGLLADPPVAQAAYASVRPAANRRDPTARVVQLVAPPGEFADGVEEMLPRIQADMQRAQDGVALPANGVEDVCRRCELRSLCRHGYVRNASAHA